MNRLAITSIFILALVVLPSGVNAQCQNSERWPIKTGTDAGASSVNLNSPTATTIANLSAISAPHTLPESQRIQPTETTLWRINATLVKFVHAYDSDYHMVFSDGAGHTMISEIPDPNCIGPGSAFAAGIAHARAQFDARFTATESFQTVNVPVQITGVGFFDYKEGQEGIAPNAIELHPIIDLNFNASFDISPAAPSMAIARGDLGTSTITSTPSGAFNSSVSLSATGLPSGATASFSPSSIGAPGNGTSTLTITTAVSTPPGTYNVTVSGTGGGQTHTAQINLTVSTAQQLLGNSGFENGSNSPAPWTVSSGVIDNSSSEAPHTGSWKAWLDGYGSAHTDSILQTVSIPASATNATLSFWLHISTVETASTANDTLKAQIRNSSGTVLATLAMYSNLNAASGYSQQSFDLTSYIGQTVQVYLIGVENSTKKSSFVVDDFALTITNSGPPADFSLSASPTSLTIAQSGSGASTISSSIAGSFNSSIALSTSGLPAGATASFAPASVAAPGSGSSNMTILVGSATAPGSYNVTVTGTGGGITHSIMIGLTITNSGPPADFSLSASPTSLTIAQSGSGASTISSSIAGSFNSSIALSTSGLPAGATANFAPASVAAPGSGSSSMTILVGSTTAPGSYTVTVTGTGGGITHSITIGVTITGSSGGTTQQLLGNPGFENGSNAAPWTATSGVIDSSSSEAAHGGSWKAWLDGFGTAHTDTLLQTVPIPSTATSAGLSFWLHIDTKETSTSSAYDTLKVQVRNSSGTVLATLGTYSNLNAATGYKLVSFDLSSYKGQTIQIYLVGVEDGSLQTSFVVDDFALNAIMP